MVSSTQVPRIDKVIESIPPRNLTIIFGSTLARLMLFFLVAFRTHANYVGGFHLLPNALVALLVGKLRGIPSIYICGGGVREYEGGGHNTENAVFRQLNGHSIAVESRLKKAIAKFDYILTMGYSVKREIERIGIAGRAIVLPGGFDDDLFSPRPSACEFDLVLVGRLSTVKNVELFLNICRVLMERSELRSAVVIGDGPSGNMLRTISDELGLESAVFFAGWQDDIESWLNRSKVFVLTSNSEGLSQAMVQAMLCGCPAVVPNIGDLRDIVHDGKSGFLIEDHDVDDFVEKIGQLLRDDSKRLQMGLRARSDAQKYSNDNSASIWDEIFTDIGRAQS